MNERTNLYERFTLRFRLIVWFNEAKIDYDGYAGEKISKDLIKKIRTLNLYKKPIINFESITADPARCRHPIHFARRSRTWQAIRDMSGLWIWAQFILRAQILKPRSGH